MGFFKYFLRLVPIRCQYCGKKIHEQELAGFFTAICNECWKIHPDYQPQHIAPEIKTEEKQYNPIEIVNPEHTLEKIISKKPSSVSRVEVIDPEVADLKSLLKKVVKNTEFKVIESEDLKKLVKKAGAKWNKKKN